MEQPNDNARASDNWNVAPGYVNFEVLVPILNFSKYRRIARFGSEQQDLTNLSDDIRTFMRLDALDRMGEELDILISSCVIATKKDQALFLSYRQDLEELLTFRSGVVSSNEDQISRRTFHIIDEQFFNEYITFLIRIKEKVVELANKNNLIFPQSEVITKQDIFERVINRG